MQLSQPSLLAAALALSTFFSGALAAPTASSQAVVARAAIEPAHVQRDSNSKVEEASVDNGGHPI